MTNKPNTRPWDDPEDDEYDRAFAYLLARDPDMERDMALYASIMERGASLALTIASALQWLCTAAIMTHIRTPRWVKRTIYYAGRFLIGFTAAAGIMWLLSALFVR